MGWLKCPKPLVVFALVSAAVFVLLFWPIEIVVDAGEQDAETPKLVVLVVFDQMRGDYLKRWENLYGEGGFKRLMHEGAWYANCHYPYALTLTAPGHASLATGCSPDRHGVVGNDWYSRAEAEMITSVAPPPNQKRQGVGPYRRMQETFGDTLMAASKGKAKVVSLSIKDRAAILMAALRAQLCYWLNGQTGDFITSPYYRDEPHPWVKQFNQGRPADAWKGKEWQRLKADLDYTKYSGPDNFFAEGIGYGQGRIFPHPFPDADARKPLYYSAMQNSPAGNDLLLAFAKRAIDAEHLGQRDTTDVLCLSFSSNDSIGHCWGPDSQEVLDITLRSDATMKGLLEYLDAKVGKGRYVVAVSADHGICPLPEIAKSEAKDGGRVPPELMTSQAEAFLNGHFLKNGDQASWLETPRKGNAWVYLNRPTIKELKLTEAEVEKALASWLTRQPGVQAAYTRTELLAGTPTDPIGRAVRKSFYPEASGDVIAVLQPYYMFSPPIISPKTLSYRTTHGSPHPYDTHVPLLFMGPGIVPGVRDERITPQATASVLARAMGVPAPKGAEAPVPEGLFRK